MSLVSMSAWDSMCEIPKKKMAKNAIKTTTKCCHNGEHILQEARPCSVFFSIQSLLFYERRNLWNPCTKSHMYMLKDINTCLQALPSILEKPYILDPKCLGSYTCVAWTRGTRNLKRICQLEKLTCQVMISTHTAPYTATYTATHTATHTLP